MVYVLWTGGWDSTYLLCKRAREGMVQPIYLRIRRENEPWELKAQTEILSMLREQYHITTILEPIILDENTLPPFPDYDVAYKRLRYNLGWMYRSLGKVPLLYPQCEIGIEGPAPGFRDNNLGRIETYMLSHGLLIRDGIVDPDAGDADVRMIYGGFHWPILHINALQMLSDIRVWGWESVFHHTRTCNASLSENCGVCSGCEVKWRYGDAFRFLFHEEALKNHEIKTWLLTEKGYSYAKEFTRYIVTEGTASVYPMNKDRSKLFRSYFKMLKDTWPEGREMHAPLL